MTMLTMSTASTTTPGPGRNPLEIRSEAHGPHWVAWLARPSDGKPQRSAVLIGRTREEAEANARQWAAR